jgi:hypothetical protein
MMEKYSMVSGRQAIRMERYSTPMAQQALIQEELRGFYMNMRMKILKIKK